MRNALELADCLYIVPETELEQLKALLLKYNRYMSPSRQTEKDFLQALFNIYVVLVEEPPLLHMEKFMLYSSNIYCLHVIQRNASVKEFLRSKRYKSEVRFVLAYHLTACLYNMLEELLLNSAHGTLIQRVILEGDYYRIYEDATIQEDTQSLFYIVQKQIIHCLHETVASGRFEQELQMALQLTRDLLIEKETI